MRALRHARRILQLLFLAIAVLIVAHGLYGPQIAPRNLATVLTWVHYRGLLIVALLALGNVFCLGCPMVLVRDLGRRVVHPAFRFPRVLRTKWFAVALLIAVFFSYELFDLWDLPSATAWLVVAYFATALAVDILFAGASFCKYVCPIGQFNFVASTMAPAELRVRDLGTCRSCKTVDCIRGTRVALEPRESQMAPRPLTVVRRGCELGLFQPAKVGNMDCTFCLDCVQACPHDNVTLGWRVPGDELLFAGRRSGIGTLSRRRDIAALATVFTFAALLNAFAMTRPVYQLERSIAATLHVANEWPVLLTIFALALIVLPALSLGGAALLSRTLACRVLRRSAHGFDHFDCASYAGPTPESIVATATRYSYGLIPLGVAMWLAHYGFHLLTGAFTIIPVTQSAAADVAGWNLLGDPLWRLAGLAPGSVFPLQIGVVLVGAIGSLALMYRITHRDQSMAAGISTMPWGLLVGLLTTIALWILAQPMEMRGLSFLG